MGTERKVEHYQVAAHPRVTISVSLRMAASAEAPWHPMSLFAILRGVDGDQ